MIPNIACDHCVLRARYNSHKQGESTFYQCADITIAKTKPGNTAVRNHLDVPLDSQKTYSTMRTAVSLSKSGSKSTPATVTNESDQYNSQSKTLLFGFAYSSFQPNTVEYVSVDPATGEITAVTPFDFGVRVDRTPVHDGHYGSRQVELQQQDVKYIVDGVLTLDPFKGVSILMYHDKGDLDSEAKILMQIGTRNGTIITLPPIFDYHGAPINGLIFQSME
jgi:hypothetical protein